jgi:RNA polymerase sigma factor (sigma-70 family)
MPANERSTALRRFRAGALLGDGGGISDTELLEHFVARRDEAAFEALVRRHGPMVLGVCRRVLRHPQDAEDAFQATFVVLARKAASIARRELLGNWLYGVAYRTAREARSVAGRRRARERQLTPMIEPRAHDRADEGRELRPLLDRELSRLPERYRAAVVLCDLEGRTRRDAARQLGVPVGTLSGRLTKAHRLLARRLARCGLAVGAGLVTAVWSEGAATRLPPLLVAPAVRLAVDLAGSAQVAALAQGVINAMFMTKLKAVAALVLAAGVFVGTGLFMCEPQAAPASSSLADPQAEGTRADERPANALGPRVLKLDARGRRVAWSPDGKILAVVTKVEKTFFGIQYDRRGSGIHLWDVETGKELQTLAADDGKGLAFQEVAFSPDGTRLAATVTGLIQKGDSLEIRNTIKVWDVKSYALKRTLEGSTQLVCVAWSPESKWIASGDPARKEIKVWNAATGAVERTLATGIQPWSVAFAPDGKTLAVGGQTDDHAGQVQWWDVATWTLKRVSGEDRYTDAVAFSADARILASAGGAGVTLWDARTGQRIHALAGAAARGRSVVLSPDGRRVAAGGHDGNVRLWDARTGELKDTLKGHRDEVRSVALSPDGKTLASVSQDATLRLWKLSERPAEKK